MAGSMTIIHNVPTANKPIVAADRVPLVPRCGRLNSTVSPLARKLIGSETEETRGSTMTELTIAHETKHMDGRDVHILRPEGYIDASTFPVFEAAVTQLVEHGHYHLQVDFERLTSINSTALGLLMATWRQVHPYGGTLVVDISKASDNLKKLLRSLGMRFDDEDDGLAGVAVRRPLPPTPPRVGQNKAKRNRQSG